MGLSEMFVGAGGRSQVARGKSMSSTSGSTATGNEAPASRPRIPGGSAFLKPFAVERGHGGVPYLAFMKSISDTLQPRSYLEIGTNTGDSLGQFECDALCIDPNFRISGDVIGRRRRTHFFQIRSDEFFRDYNPVTFFPGGIDVVFLDGLHHFETTLRDFINVERNCHSRSVVLIHDCLPTSVAMTSRTYNGDLWTGDVWLLLPILKRYRPDIRVALFDCPYTGLVACTALNPSSTVLRDNYYVILDEFMNAVVNPDTLANIGRTYPYFDTVKLTAAPDNLPLLFG